MKLNLILVFNLLFLTNSFALDPSYDFQKLQEDDFHIIFDAKSYQDARDILESAKRSRKILDPIFGVKPSSTVFIVNPDTDIANGAATAVPRPTVFSILQPPTPLSSVNYYSYWGDDVTLHEYAHILNMEPTRGVFKPFRWIFGSFVRPNMFLPRWYLEGLAVEMESRFNPTGRLKSTDYDSLIRALYLDGLWGKDNLSAINETSTPTWPQGQRPYFYGALLWHEMYEQKGPEIVKTLNDSYAARVPYVISAPFEKEFNKSYANLLSDVFKKYESYAQKQIQTIQSKSVTKSTPIKIQKSIFHHSPEISPDHLKIVFVSIDQDGDSSLFLIQRNNTKEDFSFQRGVRLKNSAKSDIQKVTWAPDSQTLYFDAVDTFDRNKSFYDIYSYNLITHKQTQVTQGLRAREPSVSQDGNFLVFIKASGSQTEIAQYNLKSKNLKIIYTPDRHSRVSRPQFLDSSKIVFAQKKKDGSDQLIQFDLNENKIIKKFELLKHSAQPSVTNQGVVFTSYDSGVENLYITNKDFNNLKPLTNSLTRVVNGTYDSFQRKIYFSELTGHGVFLKKSNLANITPPLVEHPIKKNFENTIVEPQSFSNNQPEASDYYGLKYMFPQYWLPFYNSTEDGSIISLSIPGSDALGFHKYLLQGTYDSRPEKWSTALSYSWTNQFGESVFSVYDLFTYYTSLQRTTQNQGGMVQHSFFIPGLSNNFRGFLGYEYEKSSIPSSQNEFEFQGPSIGLRYSDLSQKLTQIAPTGQSFGIEFTEYLPNSTKNEYRKTQLDYTYFHSRWLPDRHRLAFKLRGVQSERNRSILLGTTTTDTPLIFGPATNGFYVRGYPPGEFIGYSIGLGKLEYKFPLADIYSGPNNTFPLFLKRAHAEVFAEALSLDGVYVSKSTNASRSTDFKNIFYSAGAEFKLDATLAYHLPVTFITGAGYGFEEDAFGELRIYFLLESPFLF